MFILATKSPISLSILFFSAIFSAAIEYPPELTSLLPSDAVYLLSFKLKADLDDKLLYTVNEKFDYCLWRGVKCAQGRVVRFALQGVGLRGVFSADTLTRLDQLRVLILENNSLSGPIPDLSALVNLKSLILDQNMFSGYFPPSILLLHRLRVLDLSFNNLTGSIPVGLNELERLNSLHLERNQFSGTIPPLNQELLESFNVSGNNLTGPIPVTATLSRFGTSSFLWNPSLCGEIVNKGCTSQYPFFDNPNVTSQPAPLGQSAESQGEVILSPPSPKQHKRTGVVLGFSLGVTIFVAALLGVFAVVKKKRGSHPERISKEPAIIPSAVPAVKFEVSENKKLAPQKLIIQEKLVHQSGDLVFCSGETPLYTLEHLMRASAELLGRGTIGITYKAVLANQLNLTVKRLDGNKTAITGVEAFNRHLDGIGKLRHPNLVPVRAYFQAKGERLVIFDYQPNGSLFNLIHGSRSNRAKPLHWTSCLKIAEDVARGLAHIHHNFTLVHGNLKSTNILLGPDFEACLTDYCLSFLADSSSNIDPDSACYKAPETRNSSRRATKKSDVYTFGILLLELLTGKHPSQHPFLVHTDVQDWVRAMREGYDREDDQLGMLSEVACVCSLTSPEQRPTMWQVLKMIEVIKENVAEDDTLTGRSIGFS